MKLIRFKQNLKKFVRQLLIKSLLRTMWITSMLLDSIHNILHTIHKSLTVIFTVRLLSSIIMMLDFLLLFLGILLLRPFDSTFQILYLLSLD